MMEILSKFNGSDRSLLVSFLLCTVSFGIFSQNYPTFEQTKEKYKGQHAVELVNDHKIEINMVKNVPVITHHYHSEYMILDQNAIASLTDEEIDFNSFETLKINEAFVLVPKEKGYKKVAVTSQTTQDADNDGMVFHDDNKITTLVFPQLAPGTIRVLDYTIVMSENKFPFGFYFISYYPIENAQFSIECDTNVHLVFHEYNMDKFEVKRENNIVKNKITTSWKAVNAPTFLREENAPASRYYIPHVLGQIGYYQTKEERVNVVNDLDDLHNWYFKNIEEIYNEQPSQDLHVLADSITRGITDETEKVKAIYYWVQNNIKYIAFEEGVNGFVPRQPDVVLKKRYGDCKDMATIIYSLLKAEDIPAYLTWVGSRDLPYRYTEFASTNCDNHMITTYKKDGKDYFLDATNSYLPFGEYASFTQGKEVLVNISDKEYEVIQMPETAADKNSYRDSSVIEIKDRKITGNSVTVLDGYYEQLIQPRFAEIAPDKQDKAVSNTFTKGNNSFHVTKSELVNLSDREKPLEIDYEFEVDNYVTSYENEIYVNLVLDKDLSLGEVKNDRVAPVEFDYKSADSYKVVLIVPEGYQVVSIPENVSSSSDIVDFNLKYNQQNNNVIMELEVKVKTLLLNSDQFKTWNDFVKLSKKAIAQSVVLKKIN